MSSAPPHRPLTIGVLALQGAYDAHATALEALGATPRLVRTPEQLAGLDGLIMPGGESTTMLKSLERGGFFEALAAFVAGKPTFGTCAGAILLAKDVANSTQRCLGALDISVERNAYGRQNESAILSSETALPGAPLEMVFIRAPRISRVGAGVETLAKRGDRPGPGEVREAACGDLPPGAFGRRARPSAGSWIWLRGTQELGVSTSSLSF